MPILVVQSFFGPSAGHAADHFCVDAVTPLWYGPRQQGQSAVGLTTVAAGPGGPGGAAGFWAATEPAARAVQSSNEAQRAIRLT